MNSNAKDKKTLISKGLFLLLLFVVLVFFLFFGMRQFMTLTWFSENPSVSSSGMQIILKTIDYELLIVRNDEYDTTFTPDPGDPGATPKPKYDGVSVLKDKLASAPYYNYDFVETSSLNAEKLALELVNETVMWDEGVGYRHVTPGACGTLTFYLRPRAAGDVVADMSILISCFESIYEDEVLTLSEVESETVLNLLKGHILFFTERTGASDANYKYDGFVADGHLVYDTSQHAGDLVASGPMAGCYEIVLYWEWPMTYYAISEGISATPLQKRYPASLATYLDENRNYFFATNQDSSDPEELSDGYNDGDQTIGEHASFIVAYVVQN